MDRIVQVWLLSFLLLVTFVGGYISFRLSKRLGEYRSHVDEIAKVAGLGSYLVQRRGDEKLRTKNLLLILYSGAFIGLFYLLISPL